MSVELRDLAWAKVSETRSPEESGAAVGADPEPPSQEDQ
ncbi:hypothetical protein [Alloactinosynnema sp. L-07]|nr:hypothetical protein [Alloactinosynnema sp. L-07]